MDALLPLAGTSLRSVATVAACASVGAYARRQGILDERSEKFLDQFISSVCLPCLILRKVPPLISFQQLLTTWPLLLLCLCTVVYGLLAGAAAARLLKLRSFSGLIMTAVAFPNSFSVPMTLLLALGPHPALQAWDASDASEATAQALHDRVVVLFLNSFPIWVVARWGIGFPVLSGAFSFQQWRKKVLNPPVKVLHYCEGVDFQIFQPAVTAVDFAGRCSVPLLLMVLGAKVDGIAVEVFAAGGKGKSYEALPSPSKPESVKIGVGDCEKGPAVEQEPKIQLEQPPPSEMPLRGHLAVLLLRQLFGALLGLLVAFGVRRCGVSDKVLLMTLLLQSCGPPMINLSVMAGVSGTAQKDAAKVLLITYLASVFTWVMWTAIFLSFL
ncbi:unnamed protein product [Effrenium voratum]|uniref:Auxin efflux carrier family protein n=1 Tax=Effrenium voratum TaxID=2562239 RepID=A0AA36J1W9_9DINO|nr:unnamed protein product [Effrenium voratum]